MINKRSKIFLAGHKGMVGSAIYKALKKAGYKKIIVISRENLNLLDQSTVFSFLKKKKPDLTIIAAAKVGGLLANSKFKQKFIYENLQIQNNLIHGSYLANTKNLIFLSSSCVYPKFCKQPMKEEYILTGKLEETNDSYALAKLAGMNMCMNYSINYKLNYISLMPPNLYGPNDNYDNKYSHFYPALLKKIYIAKKRKKKFVILWGTGRAKRELMFVDDFANAVIYFMRKKIKEPFINIGTGKAQTINWYAKYLMNKIGVNLKIKFDKSVPDGMPKKCLNISKARKYGWRPKNDFDIGFKQTYYDFLRKNNKII